MVEFTVKTLFSSKKLGVPQVSHMMAESHILAADPDLETIELREKPTSWC
jgi:hypothetical protein